MIKNYVKTALRSLRRSKLFSAINILRLSIGLSTALHWATGLTIFISCLGLLGLVIYATNLHTVSHGMRHS